MKTAFRVLAIFVALMFVAGLSYLAVASALLQNQPMQPGAADNDADALGEVAAKVAEAETYLDTFFIEDADPTALGDAAVSGMVEATGARGMVTACVYPVAEGMEIKTNTEKVHKARKTTLEMLLSTHEKKCLSCVRSGNCEFQKLCADYGIEDENIYDGYRRFGCALGSRQQQMCSLPSLRSSLPTTIRVGYRRERSRYRYPHCFSV